MIHKPSSFSPNLPLYLTTAITIIVSLFLVRRALAEKVDFQSYSAGQWKNSAQIYQSLFIYCHGTGIGPAILGRHYSPQALMIFVRNGINTMPTFRQTEINNKELEDLAKWVEQASPSQLEGPFQKGSR